VYIIVKLTAKRLRAASDPQDDYKQRF